MPQISAFRFGLLLVVLFGVFFWRLGAAQLWDRDEPRNARASHEMLQRSDWIVPTFNNQLRDHKPILVYWGQMAGYALLGESEFTARLPSALYAVLTVLAVGLLASRMSGVERGFSREGFWAAAALATCLLFVMAGRAATPDAGLIAFSTLGIAAIVWSAVRPAHPYSAGRVGPARWPLSMIGYIFLGLAVLAKGPVGCILPLAVVHVWWLVCRRWETEAASPSPESSLISTGWRRRGLQYGRELWRTFGPWQCCRAIWALRAIPGGLLVIVVAAPWYLAVGYETDGAFLRGFFLDHNLARAVSSREGHDGSWLFYPAAFLVGTFPWSLWLVPWCAWARRAILESPLQRQILVLSGAWVAVYMFAFSCAQTKLPSYITPCYAGAALAIGLFLRQFETVRPLPAWRRLSYGTAVVVGGCILGGIFWLSRHEGMPTLAWISLGGGIIALTGILAWWLDRRQQPRLVPGIWLGGATAFHVLLFAHGAPVVDSYRTDLKLLQQLQQRQTSRHWLTVGGLEPSWVHYLDLPIHELQGDLGEPAIWTRIERHLVSNPDARLIVVGDEAHRQLQRRRQQAGPGAIDVVSLGTTARFLRAGQLTVYAPADSPVARLSVGEHPRRN